MTRRRGVPAVVAGVALAAAAALLAGGSRAQAPADAKPPFVAPIQVAPGIWFEQHNDIPGLGSNVSWIEFADFVAVVDAAFPRGVELALKNIKKTTRGKPIRYAIVTHYHGDHAFGSGVFAREGAQVVAHVNAAADFVRTIPSYARRAGNDKLFAKYKAAAPSLTFTDRMTIDDGKGRRAELYHFGHAHTSGCIFTFLPREKVLLSGDAVVNGAYNWLGDADVESWIGAIARAEALGAEIVLPGHGPVGKGDLLRTQREYFVELRSQVGRLVADGKSLAEIQALVDVPAWKAWTGASTMKADNVADVHKELTRGRAGAGDPRGGAVALPMPAGLDPAAQPKVRFMAEAFPAADRAALAAIAPNLELVEARSRAEALAKIAGVHGISGGLVSPEVIRAAKDLRWVQTRSAGVDGVVTIPELRDDDRIVLTNMRGMHGPNIADHVFALLLSLTRGVPTYLGLQAQEKWGREDGARFAELPGKTMLVVGMGGIGREVARRAAGFGMRVVATDPKPGALPAFVERVEAPDRLLALLPIADVVVMTAPLTPETRNLFDAAAFAAMKPTAYFVNIARGQTYDNLALAAALRAGKLAGAGVDVTDPEPLPAGHPLWKAPNVVITPHVAGQSPESRQRIRALYLENLRRFAAGEPLLNVVDKKAGY